MHGDLYQSNVPGRRLKKIAEATRLQEFKNPNKKKKKKQKEKALETNWSFYIYVALTLLNWSEDFFLHATPNLWLKSYIQYLETNVESFEVPETLSLDESPFW